jgi:TPR repeat protein
MEAIDSEKKEIHVFSATALKSKKADNVADYLVNINHASTRDLNSLNWTITRSDNSGKFTNRRVALLIANTNYFFRPKLINPMYDCNALSDKLLELGFDVYTAFDCASSQLRDVVIDFSKAADNYDIALFFYSGHGVQDEGQNYLIPVDRPLYNKSDLDYCVKCEFVRNQLDLSKCANRIILFDACRSPNTWARDVSDTWGQMEGSLGTYISFSTKSGKKASDGESGGNSPYTTALLKCISAPNRELTLVMGDVVRETAKITNNQQEPTGTGNFKNELFLNPDSTSSNSQVRVDSDLLVDQANKLCEEKKYAEAFDLYSQAAAQNNVRAINNIGLCYEYGEGVTQNYEKAITYYRDAADKGFAQAYLNLGRCYLEGNGVREDHKEAVEYFIKAEKLDIPEASAMLGACFYDGVGVEQDLGKAFEYFKKAANREVAMAQYFLFICYANGTGVKQNDEQAIIWLKKAASHDYDDANISLGKCYENGLGVEQNAIEAARCYRKAAENDNAQAEYY